MDHLCEYIWIMLLWVLLYTYLHQYIDAPRRRWVIQHKVNDSHPSWCDRICGGTSTAEPKNIKILRYYLPYKTYTYFELSGHIDATIALLIYQNFNIMYYKTAGALEWSFFTDNGKIAFSCSFVPEGGHAKHDVEASYVNRKFESDRNRAFGIFGDLWFD